MNKYLCSTGLLMLLLSGCSRGWNLGAVKQPYTVETVIISSATYDSRTQKITFLVGHSVGCGRYWDYAYDIVDSDEQLKEATFDVVVTTDNVCEAATFGKPVVMELPELSFKPEKLIFKAEPTDIAVVLSD